MNVQSDALEDCLLMVDGATKDDPNLPTLEEMKDPDMNFIDDEGIRTNIFVAKPAGISRPPEWAPEWCHEALGEESMLRVVLGRRVPDKSADEKDHAQALENEVRQAKLCNQELANEEYLEALAECRDRREVRERRVQERRAEEQRRA